VGVQAQRRQASKQVSGQADRQAGKQWVGWSAAVVLGGGCGVSRRMGGWESGSGSWAVGERVWAVVRQALGVDVRQDVGSRGRVQLRLSVVLSEAPSRVRESVAGPCLGRKLSQSAHAMSPPSGLAITEHGAPAKSGHAHPTPHWPPSSSGRRTPSSPSRPKLRPLPCCCVLLCCSAALLLT
jgi:hypothetical protein